MTKLRHLNKSGCFKSGNLRYYFRPKGRKGVAMPDAAPDSPAFIAAYAGAHAAVFGAAPRVSAQAGSVAAGIIAYKQSDAFRALAPGTRRYRANILDGIIAAFKGIERAKLRELKPDHVKVILRPHSGHAHINALKACRGFLSWAVDEGLIAEDPSAGIKRRKVAKSDGHAPWTAEDVARFRERWAIDTPARLAFELLHWTGARISDAIRLGEGNISAADGVLTYRQKKTGAPAYVPFGGSLPFFAIPLAGDLELLKQAIAARSERHLTFITTLTGKSRSVKAASQWFAALSRDAGIEGKAAHGLRKARAIALVGERATPHAIGAWTGHKSLREIEHYTRAFDRRSAVLGADRERKSSNFSDPVPTMGKK